MTRRRRKRSTKSVILELLFVGVVIILLLNFLEPASRWLGEYMADSFERSTTEASP